MIKSINPLWEDEEIYQETRRIIIAEYNHIIYNEWLPILIGESMMELYDLTPKKKGYFMKYDKFLYPNIANEFSTAAFRFGHTMVRSNFSLVTSKNKLVSKMSLIESIFNPIVVLEKDGLDSLARGCNLIIYENFKF